MEHQTNRKPIRESDLWRLLRRRFVPLVCIAFVSSLSFYLFRLIFVPPSYQSTATLYILRQEGVLSGEVADSDFSLALNVVSDCAYLLTSNSVLEEVIRTLQLDTDARTLAKRIQVHNPQYTRILEVSAQASTPEQAKQISDLVCQIGQERIAQAMGFQQVNLYEHGTLPTAPCNQAGWGSCLLAGLIGFVLGYLVFLVRLLAEPQASL